MTVMDAPSAGEITTASSGTPKTDAIVKDLAPHVWALLCRGKIRAALVLLEARVDAFEEAWREEYAAIPSIQITIGDVVGVRNCTSSEHALLSCPQALTEGVLPEGHPFCGYCNEQQLALQEAPRQVIDDGKIVHVVTPSGTIPIPMAG